MQPCPACKGAGLISVATGTALRRARETAGMMASTMAERLKLSPSYISDIERGKRKCPARVLEAYEKL